METWMRLGGPRIESYIRIYLSTGYSYILYGFTAKSFSHHIPAHMDNGARGAILCKYAVYIPAAARP
jgi:hypothetical protein